MKRRFFKYIQIDSDVIKNFCIKHPEMNKFLDSSAPFSVRVGCKLYPTLLHTIITQQKDDAPELINFRLETFAKKLKNNITPRRVNKLTFDGLKYLVGENNAQTISAITKDIISKKLNLKKISKLPEIDIELSLATYPHMTRSIIKTFALFGCFKQNVFCNDEPEFINGLKLFLNKNEISQEDIDKISRQYNGELTIFSLCMFKLNNEKGK